VKKSRETTEVGLLFTVVRTSSGWSTVTLIGGGVGQKSTQQHVMKSDVASGSHPEKKKNMLPAKNQKRSYPKEGVETGEYTKVWGAHWEGKRRPEHSDSMLRPPPRYRNDYGGEGEDVLCNDTTTFSHKY